MRPRLFLSVAAGALMALSGAAFAQTSVTATSDLNIRSGPGPQHPVVGVINVDTEATLQGCLEGSKWCAVTYNGVEGWAYSDYLIASNEGVDVVVTERPPEMAVPVVTYEAPSEGTTAGGLAGAAGGAVAGALIAGPVGAVVGGIAGAATGGIAGAAIDPAPEVITYVEQNPVDPVYLEGEVVVGAGIPQEIEIRPIPEYEYSYLNVNGQPVLVEPESRRIVYVVR